MQNGNTNLDVYRTLFWANQGMLNAMSVLNEAETSAKPLASGVLTHHLRRSQEMIEETRLAMNQILSEWVTLRD